MPTTVCFATNRPVLGAGTRPGDHGDGIVTPSDPGQLTFGIHFTERANPGEFPPVRFHRMDCSDARDYPAGFMASHQYRPLFPAMLARIAAQLRNASKERRYVRPD